MRSGCFGGRRGSAGRSEAEERESSFLSMIFLCSLSQLLSVSSRPSITYRAPYMPTIFLPPLDSLSNHHLHPASSSSRADLLLSIYLLSQQPSFPPPSTPTSTSSSLPPTTPLLSTPTFSTNSQPPSSQAEPSPSSSLPRPLPLPCRLTSSPPSPQSTFNPLLQPLRSQQQHLRSSWLQLLRRWRTEG